MEKLNWKTYEYLYVEKTPDWYWIVSIVTISIVLVSIILNNIIFAILILVSSFTLLLLASRKPEIVSVDIDSDGITIGTINYPYIHLDSFWVEKGEVHPKIIFKSKKAFMPFIVITIEDIEPDKVRETLLEYLPEKEHVEPLLEKLLVRLGF